MALRYSIVRRSQKCHAKRPLVPNGMQEHQRVHEDGKAGGLNEHKGGGENGELQLTAFEMIQFFAIQRAHDSFFCDLDPGRCRLV